MQHEAATHMQHASLRANAVKVLERNTRVQHQCDSEPKKCCTDLLHGGGAATPCCNTSEPVQQAERPPGVRPATCAASCYEIEPGKWIHHPWNGCRTAKPKRPGPRRVETMCWHCGGVARCPCITCAEGLPAGERGQCLICHGSGKVNAWVQ